MPRDSLAAAELMLMAGSLAVEHFFASELQCASSVAQYLFAHRHNLVSFDLAWVAEEGHEVAALLHGYPGYGEGALALSSLRFLPSLLRIVGIQRMLRLAYRAQQFSVPLHPQREHNYFLVNALAVYECFRGRGIATLLLEVAEQEARRLGLSSLRLVVRTDNGPAIAMYRRFGFIMLDEVVYHLHLDAGQDVPWAPMVKALT